MASDSTSDLRVLARDLAPLVYLGSHFTVLICSLMAVSWVELHWGFHTWMRQGDIDAVVVCLVAGALVFPAATLMLARLDAAGRTWRVQHLHHSSAVYVFVAAAAVYLITEYADHRDGLGYGVAFGAFSVGLYAAAVNAFLLWRVARQPSKDVTSAMARRSPEPPLDPPRGA